MCGICGFNWDDEILLNEMLESIKHRGPDNRGTYTDGKISLGHNRLSIIDLSKKGKNPLWNEDRSKCIIYNGEIYNYKELKKDLIKKKHIFYTKTDTEVILHGFEEYGKEILTKLNGMFAFAIYDIKNNSLFIARDRLGIKPMYYHFNSGKLTFASEIKAIIKNKKIKKVPNHYAISEYLTFQNILDDKTFFEGIHLLLPGHYIKLQNNNLEVKQYWKPEFNYKQRTDEEMLEEFKGALKRSVKRHLISDVPVGAYLSGGFDSGTITTIASKMSEERLNTFTCAFDIRGEYDETTCARAVAEQIGANNYEVRITKKDFLENIEKMVYHLDEPKIGIPIISQYSLSRLASKHVKVTLTGHGGDELFAGYPVFQAKLYKLKAKGIKEKIKTAYKILKDKKRLNLAYYLLMPYIYPEINNGIIIVFPEKEKNKLLTKSFLEKTKGYSPQKAIDNVFEGYKNLDEIEKLQILYLKTYLPSLFIAQDKMDMAHSTEARIPLCDNELIDFSLSVPIEQKIKNNELKSIIKKSMKGIIPDILYQQEKRGFPTPLGPWLKSGLDAYFRKILLSDKAIKRKIYSEKYIKKLLKKTDFWSINKLWCLINIEIWFRRFIDEN
jgi:asparagine synthase (glutamine-hydrolysing)